MESYLTCFQLFSVAILSDAQVIEISVCLEKIDSGLSYVLQMIKRALFICRQ
jgi:hypothetical protein